MNLSDRLKLSRTNRPDEWSMDEYIRQAEKLEQQLNERDERLFVPGVMYCAKCDYSLIRSNINMSAGSVTAGDNKTGPCPNGCGPLWPETWEKRCNDNEKLLDESFERSKQLSDANAAIRWTHGIADILHHEYYDLPGKPYGIDSEADYSTYQAAIERALKKSK